MQYDPVALHAMTSLRQLGLGDLADYHVIGSWGVWTTIPPLIGPDILMGRIGIRVI
jgi:hypothetical protein